MWPLMNEWSKVGIGQGFDSTSRTSPQNGESNSGYWQTALMAIPLTSMSISVGPRGGKSVQMGLAMMLS